MIVPALLLAAATVVYVGVAGAEGSRIERQLATLLERAAHVETHEVSAGQRTGLAELRPDARAFVRELGVAGLVVGRLLRDRRVPELRLVLYDGRGKVHTLVDVPLAQVALDRFALGLLRKDLVPSVVELAPPLPARETSGEASAEEPAEGGSAGPPEGTVASVEKSASSVVEAGAGPLHAEAAFGLGVLSRAFAPVPRAIAGYDSHPVGAVRASGEVMPIPRVQLGFAIDRSFAFTSELGGESAPSSISRWEAGLGLRIPLEVVALDGLIGVGQQSFRIESKDPARSPDGDYLYPMVGLRLQAALGETGRLGARALFEPVVSGDQATAAAFGPARRFGVQADAHGELYPRPWLSVGARVGWQEFFWSWPLAGSRGAGGASDRYLDATVELGVRY